MTAEVFTCKVCGKGVGRRFSEGEWILCPCYFCEEKKRAKEAAARRRAHPRSLGGVNIDAAVAWMLTLPALEERIPKRKNGRRLRVDVGHRSRVKFNGRAWPARFKIRVAGGPGITAAEALEVTLHELVHVATPRSHHNEVFRRVLQRAAREAWGVEVSINPEKGNERTVAYAMDRIIIAELEKLVSNGEVKVFNEEAAPSPPKPRIDLVKKRADHAATMLARAEKRLKLAKTLHQKWAAKVRYYEKQAAKRGP